MTPQEAKALFEEDLKGGKCNDNCPECNAREMAISALEKQIPKKVEEYLTSSFCCPACTSVLSRYSQYCSNCGQALDWSDT